MGAPGSIPPAVARHRRIEIIPVFLIISSSAMKVQLNPSHSCTGPARDVVHLRRVTAAYDASSSRHPELNVDVERLLSTHRQYLSDPAHESVEERAEAAVNSAVALTEAFAGVGATFNIYHAGNAILYRTPEELVQHVGGITELLRSMGLGWHNMPGAWRPCQRMQCT